MMKNVVLVVLAYLDKDRNYDFKRGELSEIIDKELYILPYTN